MAQADRPGILKGPPDARERKWTGFENRLNVTFNGGPSESGNSIRAKQSCKQYQRCSRGCKPPELCRAPTCAEYGDNFSEQCLTASVESRVLIFDPCCSSDKTREERRKRRRLPGWHLGCTHRLFIRGLGSRGAFFLRLPHHQENHTQNRRKEQCSMRLLPGLHLPGADFGKEAGSRVMPTQWVTPLCARIMPCQFRSPVVEEMRADKEMKEKRQEAVVPARIKLPPKSLAQRH